VADLVAIRILRGHELRGRNDVPDKNHPLEDRMNLGDYFMNFHSETWCEP
jgi:hypothetical protein